MPSVALATQGGNATSAAILYDIAGFNVALLQSTGHPDSDFRTKCSHRSSVLLIAESAGDCRPAQYVHSRLLAVGDRTLNIVELHRMARTTLRYEQVQTVRSLQYIFHTDRHRLVTVTEVLLFIVGCYHD